MQLLVGNYETIKLNNSISETHIKARSCPTHYWEFLAHCSKYLATAAWSMQKNYMFF